MWFEILNPPLEALQMWRKNLEQFQRYQIFPRGLLVWHALYTTRSDNIKPNHDVLI